MNNNNSATILPGDEAESNRRRNHSFMPYTIAISKDCVFFLSTIILSERRQKPDFVGQIKTIN